MIVKDPRAFDRVALIKSWVGARQLLRHEQTLEHEVNESRCNVKVIEFICEQFLLSESARSDCVAYNDTRSFRSAVLGDESKPV